MTQTEPVEPQEPQEPQGPDVEPSEPAEPQKPVEQPQEPQEGDETPAGSEAQPDESEQPQEPQEGDEDGQDGAEPTPEEPQPGMRSEAEIEKAAKQVEQLRKSVADRVGRIFGDDANFLTSCPMCAGTAPGWLWPPSEAPLPEDQVRQIFATLGVIEPKEYRNYESYRRCDACDGLGSVKTGSRVPGFDVVKCPSCSGNGYLLSAPLPLPGTNGVDVEHSIKVTGPSVIDPADADDPAVAELRKRGFTVVPPIHFPG